MESLLYPDSANPKGGRSGLMEPDVLACEEQNSGY